MSIQQINIPAGKPLQLGALADPKDPSISSKIGELLRSIDGSAEAHLPQTFAIDVMEEPAQVLVIVLKPNSNMSDISEQLGAGLARTLPEGMHLDVWPITLDHGMLENVRETGCEL